MKRTISLLIFCFAALFLIPVLSTGAGEYVGAGECKTCHSDIYAAWEKNAHSSVFDILVEGEHEDNANCLPCHTTGFASAGDGTISYEEKNITCENCHGPGSGHVKSQSKTAIDRGDREEVCVKCHISDWSPAFDYEEYMERGVH